MVLIDMDLEVLKVSIFTLSLSYQSVLLSTRGSRANLVDLLAKGGERRRSFEIFSTVLMSIVFLLLAGRSSCLRDEKRIDDETRGRREEESEVELDRE